MLLALTDSPPLLRRWLYRLRPVQAEADLGGRGKGLHWLVSRGFPTPPAWVLTTSAFDLALNEAGLSATVAEIDWSLRGLWNDVRAAERVIAALEPQRVEAARRLRTVALSGRLEEAIGSLSQAPAPGWVLCPSLDYGREVAEHGDQWSRLGVLTGDLVPRLFVPPTRWELWDGIRQMWSASLGQDVLRCSAQNDLPLPRLSVVLHPLERLTAQDRSGWVYARENQAALIEAAWDMREGLAAVYRPQTADGGSQPTDEGWQVTDHVGQWVVFRRDPSSPVPLTGDEVLTLAALAQSVAAERGGLVRVEFLWRAGRETPLLLSVESGGSAIRGPADWPVHFKE